MTISKRLAKLNLISGNGVMTIFDEFYSDIMDIDLALPSEFMRLLWERYPGGASSLNGKVFEGLLGTTLYRYGIHPLYVEAVLSFVPNVEFDFVAYSRKYGPIILSAKTSLRERYKQADLEGMMVRQVHRKAKSFLITLDISAARLVNKKISNGQVLGLDDVIVAIDTKFDELIKVLQTYDYYEPEKIEVLTCKRLVR